MRINLSKLFIVLTLITLAVQSNAQRYKDKIFTEVDTIRDIKYGAAMNVDGQMQDLLLDFYEPSGDALEKRPLFIYIHGGGFTSGDKNELHIIGLCDQMAKRGYVVANINYRLDPNFEVYNSNSDRRAMIDAMHDARAAVRFLRKNADVYGIDTSFISIGGESAGAATSMLVNYVDEQSELASYPMANPNNIEGNSGNLGYSSETDYTLCLCGLMLDTAAVKTGDQPMLWIHGTEDNFVPYSFAQTITTRAQNKNLEYTEYTFEGGVHCPWYTSLPNWLEYLDTTINYITDFLYPKVTVSVTPFEYNNSFRVYPNPASTVLHITSNSTIEVLRITNMLGQEQKVSIQNINVKEKKVDINKIPPGIYIIQLDSGVVKFMKE